MSTRIEVKILELVRYSRELRGILPNNLAGYEASLEKKAACERYLEKIVEAAVDLAFLYIRQKGLKTPEDDSQAFDILAHEGVIPAELARRLKRAKGMRNIVAHQYGGVNDEMVFHTLKNELLEDAGELAKRLGAAK